MQGTRAIALGQRAAQVLTVATAALLLAVPVALAEECQGNKNALGVTRTLKLDTSSGPRYGKVQYKENEPLRDKEVVLTFDDGPLRPYTREVLKALKAHCTKATFFMVGRMAVVDPGMVREVAAAGHTVAVHTWSHRNLKSISPARAAGEIELGVSALQKALGRPVAPFFRFPYLADPNAIIGYLKSRGVATFSIDVDSYDFRTSSGDKMRRTVMQQLASRGRGIILMHDIQRSTAKGIRGLLDDLARGGFKVVHLEAVGTFKTRPDYDKTAEELHAKRRTTVRAAALEDPTIKWAVAASPSKSRRRISSSEREEAPSSSSRRPRKVAARPAARPQPSVSARPAGDWRNRVLGHE